MTQKDTKMTRRNNVATRKSNDNINHKNMVIT